MSTSAHNSDNSKYYSSIFGSIEKLVGSSNYNTWKSDIMLA